MSGSTQLGLSGPTPRVARVDGLGIFFICGASIWTVGMIGGMTLQYFKRSMPFLKIRSLPVTFTGVSLLHLYWALIQLDYTLAPLQPEEVQFWLTSLLYPVGLGLFFVGNAELLHVAALQRRYLEARPESEHSLMKRGLHGWAPLPSNPIKKNFTRFLRLSFSWRLSLMVGFAMIIQTILVVVMFCISRKYHSTWGISGTQVTGTPIQRQIQQAQGWEWWPAIAWQFFFYYLVAPFILFKSRKIQDTHGWRIQTTCCCLSGIVTVPMWLIAVYVPGMATANRWWIPLQWIGITVWFIQAFTVWIPTVQIFLHQKMTQETLDAIKLWEARTRRGGPATSMDTSRSSNVPAVVQDTYKAMDAAESGEKNFEPSFENNSLESVFTLRALEHTLEQNPEPLRKFSSLRDFSGENIAFLTSVRAWKSEWPTSKEELSSSAFAEGAGRRALFKSGIQLYANFISPHYAAFPVNIGSRELQALDNIFEHAARVLYGGSETTSLSDATPFSDDSGQSALFPTNSNGESEEDSNIVDLVSKKVQYWGHIPEEFEGGIFDNAERDIKYLVLTNTWPKYIRQKREEMSEKSAHSEGVGETRLTQLSWRWPRFVVKEKKGSKL